MPPPYVPQGQQVVRRIFQPDSITPYLGLRARLSQVWINRWTVLLLLVLVRVLLAAQSLQSDMASAKVEALSACTSVESMGSAMASMPHYMAKGVNDLTGDALTKAVQGLVEVLQLIVTGVEEILLFYINFLTQTYLCLIVLVVKGSVEAAVTIIEDVTGFLNKELPSIAQDITQGVNSFQNTINDFLSKINNVASLFSGNNNSPPKIDLSKQLDELNHFQLPSSINSTLDKINSSVPTFDQVKNFTQAVISIPFEALKQEIDLHLGNYAFDKSAFPVPAKEQLTFCEGNDAIDGFFNGLEDLINTARKIFIVVIVLAAILVCIPMAYREIWRWRSMKERSLLVQRHVHEPMDVVYITSRPYTSTAGMKVASMFSAHRRQILTRWAIAYATSTPALFILSLGLAGLFSGLCHYILLRSVEKVVPELTAEVSSFADKVVDKLNNASGKWANDVNGVIDGANRDINGQLFSWVNISTGAVNDTLNTFVDKTTDLLNETFGGTILYQPILGLFDCLIELKVQGIQKGLTWVSDHAHINIPDIANDTFSIGAIAGLAGNGTGQTDSFLSDPGAVTSDKISEVVVSVTNKMQDSIRKETLISAGILLVWVLVALMGIVRALILCCIRDKNRGEGGPGSAVINRDVDPNDGFTDATYFGPNNAKSMSVPPAGFDPAAEEDMYQMHNLGFVGERGLKPEFTTTTSSSAVRQSSYVQYGGDEKRGF